MFIDIFSFPKYIYLESHDNGLHLLFFFLLRQKEPRFGSVCGLMCCEDVFFILLIRGIFTTLEGFFVVTDPKKHASN